MPQTITLDGKEVTVYTEAEFIVARDSHAKGARTEAENTVRAQYATQIADLTAKATVADTLTAQMAALTAERDAMKRTSTIEKAARAKGLPDPVIDLIVNHKAVDTLDITNAEAIDAFVTPFASLSAAAPGTTPPPTTPPAKAAGSGGSPTPGASPTPMTDTEVAAKLASDPTLVTTQWEQTRQSLSLT